MKQNALYRRLLILSSAMLLATPILSSAGENMGNDWYCSEPAAHTMAYQKHLQVHLDGGSEAIANQLDETYSDTSLTTEQKKARAMKVLHDHLLKIKAGIGD